MTHRLHFATALATTLLWSGAALAQTPKVVHVAGKLTDANGVAIVDPTVNLNFKLYDDSVGGELKYNEPHTNVAVSGGWFDAYIGSSVPISPGSLDYESVYLQIDVDGVAMTPRLKVAGSFYALTAYKLTEEGYTWLHDRLAADGLGGGAAAGERGPRGYACWDLNANGQNDANEDVNADEAYNALDCQGPQGVQGVQGIQGVPGQDGADGQDGDAADAVAAVCVALNQDANCDLPVAINAVCGCQDVQVQEVYAGSLTAENGLWDYGQGLVGIPEADLACNAAFAGSSACEYGELVVASGRGELVNPTDTGGAAVTSWWANDPNADIESQCSDDAAGEAPWTYGTAHQQDTGLFVTVTRATGALSAQQDAAANCNNGSHWVACCK